MVQTNTKHEMKTKILNLLSILASFFGYLEWGEGNTVFLFQAEAEIFSKLFINPASVIHPFTMMPLAGQIALLTTLFQKRPNRMMTFIGLGGLGVLLGFMFVIGLLSVNYKIVLSTIPFLVTAFLTIRHHGAR